MKSNFIKKLKFIFIIIGIIFIGIGCYFLLSENDSKKSKLVKLDINSELVNNLYKKIPKGDFDYNKYIYFSTYKSSKQTYETLSDQFIIESALYTMDYSYFDPEYTSEETDRSMPYKLSSSKIEEKIKELFGNVDFDFDSYNASVGITKDKKEEIGPLRFNSLTSSQYIDGDYYFYEFSEERNLLDAESFYQIVDAKMDNDYIYIYDKHFNVIYNEENPTEVFDIYYDEKNKASVTLNQDEFYNLNDSLEKIETLKKIESYIYKHVFKKDENDNYYWVSTEIYKKYGH